MKLTFNQEQRKSLSSFFSSLAVAWFVAAFVTPTIEPNVVLLTYAVYISNMLFALYISLVFLEDLWQEKIG